MGCNRLENMRRKEKQREREGRGKGEWIEGWREQIDAAQPAGGVFVEM